MRIIEPSIEILSEVDANKMMKNIEKCGRVCYKSENLIDEQSAKSFIRRIIANGHESVLEHEKLTIKFICDRGVSHELVRHRIASYSQESTRYCNYSQDKFGKELTLIRPCFWKEDEEKDLKRCEELSELLPEAMIINGDGTDKDLLIEEGITEAESFASLTGIDEQNVLLSLYADSKMNGKIITSQQK